MPAWTGLKLAVLTAALAGIFHAPDALADEVGMEAQGVSPWAALHNRWGLDVRDAQNRPVSARLIERQLKRASAKAAADADYSSRLPGAQAFTLARELLAPVGALLRSLMGDFRFPVIDVWAAQSRTGRQALFIPLLAVLTACLSAPLFGRFRYTISSSSCRPLVLRC
jgi:hypothetical protein